jgi:hypothetical protein
LVKKSLPIVVPPLEPFEIVEQVIVKAHLRRGGKT